MQTKKLFARTLAAIAAAVTMMTAPVVTSTAVSVASVAAPVAMVAMTLTPSQAQAGRRDGNRVDPSAVAFDYDWDMFLVDEDGFEVIDEG